ncbi:hypothetical protein QLX08_006257 [Tetragonisca angustula]|uniref:Uncharacterized protein n=1 Tax=Tetragonisca angustula TaxID=166442 RepID=A0AAW0ZUN5_9HYME
MFFQELAIIPLCLKHAAKHCTQYGILNQQRKPQSPSGHFVEDQSTQNTLVYPTSESSIAKYTCSQSDAVTSPSAYTCYNVSTSKRSAYAEFKRPVASRGGSRLRPPLISRPMHRRRCNEITQHDDLIS